MFKGFDLSFLEIATELLDKLSLELNSGMKSKTKARAIAFALHRELLREAMDYGYSLNFIGEVSEFHTGLQKYVR